MKVFVTVGSTSFDDLIRVLDTPEAYTVMKDIGITDVTFQYGRGTYIPKGDLKHRVNVEFFDYKASLSQCQDEADIIISHAGAGTVMEVMRKRKPLIVVFNETLMHNHQKELALAMSERGHLIASGCSDLLSVLSRGEYLQLKHYEDDKDAMIRFVSCIDNVMGQ